MVVLDATIVNIAPPSAQRALGFTTVDRQWVVTAYAPAFGSPLLSNGRLAAAGKVALRPNQQPGSDRFSAAQPDQEQRR